MSVQSIALRPAPRPAFGAVALRAIIRGAVIGTGLIVGELVFLAAALYGARLFEF